MKSIRWFGILLLIVLSFGIGGVSPTIADRATAVQLQGEQGVQAGEETVAAGQQVKAELLDAPPVLSAAQQAELDKFLEAGPRESEVPLPVGNTAVERFDSIVRPETATMPPQAGIGEAPMNAPESFNVYRNTYLGATIKSTSSRVGEPTVANSGNVVFYTGNWYAAISSDGGKTFKYISPYTTFPASAGGFCCDQITTYDPSRDIFIWYLQYVSSGPAGAGTNLFRIAKARPKDAVNGDWTFWDFTSATNTEWDYPDMALSDDYLWITTNRGPFNGTFVNDAWIFKMPLDPLSVGAGFGYGFLDLDSVPALANNLSLRLTRGAHETMFFGAHNSTSQIRIFRWGEDSGTINWDDVNLSAAWFSSTHVCPGPDARDWCGFDDGRIKAAWVSQNRVGFMWGSSQGGGFAYPYIEAVRVREADRGYIDRPFFWNSGFAFAYPAASPNERGDLGVAGYYGGGGSYPTFFLAVDDDRSRAAGFPPPGWFIGYGLSSSQGPTSNRWGDYISVLPFRPTSYGWVAAGFTMQGCGTNYCTEPRYYIFGRERDLRSVSKYYDPIYGNWIPMLYK